MYQFIDSDVKKRLKNKLCFILCQDKAFEDKNEWPSEATKSFDEQSDRKHYTFGNFVAF